MEILIDYGEFSERLENMRLPKLAEMVLSEEGQSGETEVSISFVDEATMAEMNESYRGKTGPTDVLSFECDTVNFDDFDFPESSSEVFQLGDVIISPEVAEAQCVKFGNTFEEEIQLLQVHGLLHLCGWDHIEDDEAEKMEARERELLAMWRDDRNGK